MHRASASDVTPAPVDDKMMVAMNKANPGHHKLVIKAGTYPKQRQDVPVIGFSMHVVAASDLPEEMVYQVTKTMAGNVDAVERRRQGHRRPDAQGHGGGHRRVADHGSWCSTSGSTALAPAWRSSEAATVIVQPLR
jgi:hypothetical protein